MNGRFGLSVIFPKSSEGYTSMRLSEQLSILIMSVTHLMSLSEGQSQCSLTPVLVGHGFTQVTLKYTINQSKSVPRNCHIRRTDGRTKLSEDIAPRLKNNIIHNHL